MTYFRPETFLQFVKKTKPIWFLKIIWLFAFLFLTLMFFWTYKTDLNIFWGYFTFILVGLTIQAGLIYWTTYKMYNLGRQAFLELNNEDLQIIYDVDVLIKGFDLFSKKSFNVDISQPIYDFEQADIILSKESIVLLGKSKQFGTTTFALPVELITSKAKTTISNAKLLSWSDFENKLQIEIEDNTYNKPIKIEFKNNLNKLKMWLTRYY
ncbi:MAG: hypothetical protein EOP00_17030 [Pedobacter sp.]|nr:MAG: hypothetical protein EOP00_17030 [Pedobacter sp.]